MNKHWYLSMLLCTSFLWAAEGELGMIRLNSLGFLPQYAKRATITASCAQVMVKRSDDGKIVFTVEPIGPRHQNDVNQDVWMVDFTPVQTPGRYYLEAEGVGRSIDFVIDEHAFDSALYTAVRAMYLWRCGAAVTGTHLGVTFSHLPCHLNDGYEDYLGRPDAVRDGVGGWHDAGDHGKYVVNAGITVGSMFLAWDHFRERLEKISFDLPVTASGMPDFLQEIKWETDWLLKMALPDESGRVSHKLTRVNFEGMLLPEKDEEKRYFTDWSTEATADFAAMMAMAARYFKPYDESYARKCLIAAQKSYQFLLDHPQAKPFQQGDFRTGGYQTNDQDDRLWAAAELWETTGDQAVLRDLEQRAATFAPQSRRGEAAASSGKIDVDWDWGNVRNLGMFTYVLSQRQGRDAQLLTTIQNDLVMIADQIVSTAQQDAYGRPLGGRYYWGCNGTVARQVLNLQVANRVMPKREYIDAALDAVAHLFGRNYYGRSFVTGLGENPPLFPHDRRSAGDDIEPPWPGYVVGGGHSAIDWTDKQEDYRTNEVAINWQAALIYALAGF